MRLLLLAALTGIAAAPPSFAAENAPQARNLCTHATSRVAYGCPSLGPSMAWRMARFGAWQEERELRAELTTALADGRCEDARKMAVAKGRHELAARIRKACAADS